MPRKRWERALATLSEYHTNEEIGEAVGASEASVSAWRNGHADPRPASKRALMDLAEERYPEELAKELTNDE